MEEEEEVRQLTDKICRILNETLSSNAAHVRKLKELSALNASSCPQKFFTAFTKGVTSLLAFQRRTAASERAMRFISIFASSRYARASPDADNFLENLLQFLLIAATAANKSARFRACQIISEIVMRLPDDAEVSNDIWDEVIECMKGRVGDKNSSIRAFSIRALSRFANDSDNCDILELFLEVLSLEQISDVRKTLILSLPPSSSTLNAIINSTLDVSESVRKASYNVLARKFPIQTLSIKFRTVILKRGLTDRFDAVVKECLKLLKEEWLLKCCNGDPVELLKYLDVETYETVGELAMKALLRDGLVKVHDKQTPMKKFMDFSCVKSKDEADSQHLSIPLLDPEVALYWRMVCIFLEMQAREKGSDAAAATGMEAAVYAAEASDSNDLLEKVLPETVSDYVKFVKAHLEAGPAHRFASRQLLLLGEMLDYSDATNRKLGSGFLSELLNRPVEYEVDDDGNEIIIGDGINLRGDVRWANAVASLAKRVHASEFEEVLMREVERMGQPCRERTAGLMQWMQCFSVVCLLLENTKASHLSRAMADAPSQLLKSLLLPGTRHSHSDVRRVAVRCTGLFGLLEKKPSEELVTQLKLSMTEAEASPSVSVVACKALLDLGMWHGFQELDSSSLTDLPPSLDLLFSVFDSSAEALVKPTCAGDDDNDSTQSVLAEGFAKILLLSENYPTLSLSSHCLILSKLVRIYFYAESEDAQRLKQCLSVFFEHYPAVSPLHKRCVSAVFIPVMRSMWPGIDGNHAGAATVVISKMRKRAVRASRFMLQMVQSPLYRRGDGDHHQAIDATEEGLALRMAAEVMGFKGRKSSAEKSYVVALCRAMALVNFRAAVQAPAVKLMRELLCAVMARCGADDRDAAKEMRAMADRLFALDASPDERLRTDEARVIFERLDLEVSLDSDAWTTAVPSTPAAATAREAPRSTRAFRSKRQVKLEETSSEEGEGEEENSGSPPAHSEAAPPPSTRAPSQRASKTAAMTKLMTSKAAPNASDDDGRSDLSSQDDDDSAMSDQSES